MDDTITERCLLIKSIEEKCQDSFTLIQKLYDIIQIQDNRIKKLESELKYKENTNKMILFENAQYSMDSLKTLLHIIWPLTTEDEFQQTLINNNKFTDLLFENLESTSFPDLLFPLIGILSNLNSNNEFRLKNGFVSVTLTLKKDHYKIISNNECLQVFLYLLYNVSFDAYIIYDLLNKSSLIEFIKQVSQKKFKSIELKDLFFRFIRQIVNSLMNNLSTEIINNKKYLIQIREICMSTTTDRSDDSNEIVQIINRYISEN